MAGKWSAEETALLKELLMVHTVQEARQKLGRSEYAVRKQMRKLKDSKDPVKYEDMNREDGEDIRRMYKRAENKVERLKILKELYPSYTKEAILAAAQHDPFRESDKLYEQITKEKTKMAAIIKKYDEQTRKAVVEDVLLNGMTQSEAAEKYGVNPKTVSYWCRTAKEKQQAFMDYAETVENEKKKTAADTERAVEDARPYAEITTGSASEPAECNLQTDDETQQKPSYSQRLEEYNAAAQKTADGENNAEERELTDLEWAERYVDSVIDNFKKAAELLIQMAYDDPDRVALEEKLKKELFRDKAERRKHKHNPDYNTLSIKAAAFDEICGIGAEYPDRSERELLFYINGIIGLAERLRGGNIWN